MSEKKKNEKSAPKAQGGFPSYKGRPLVRSGDTLYYGSMTEKYVVKLDVKSKKMGSSPPFTMLPLQS